MMVELNKYNLINLESDTMLVCLNEIGIIYIYTLHYGWIEAIDFELNPESDTMWFCLNKIGIIYIALSNKFGTYNRIFHVSWYDKINRL